MTLRQWVMWLFVAAAVVSAVPIGFYTKPALVIGGFLTGFCAQGIKISVDTLVQTGVDDVYRGRVFALYDMIFNVGQVSAAALGAAILPDSGKSYPVLAVIVVGFAVTALVYGRLSSRAAQRGDGLDGGGLPGGVRTGDQTDERTQQGRPERQPVVEDRGPVPDP
ncbi:MFS transporter [Kribbella kalugense]|uniref:MFS transporter n=1 Tax=Kribbella kalugense TaxID=2512221 RepID=A0A4R8A151_9ACTN|nr:MFS transporter [Kribbella kalugense]